MKKSFYFPLILSSIISVTLLQGCTPVVIAGAGTGVMVAHDRRTTGTMIEDQAIELKASEAFYKDEEISENSHINVTSYNTVVLITGETSSEALRTKVGNMVSSIPKVSHVYNELTVAAPSSLLSRSSDTLITSKVKTRLCTVENFDCTRVKIVTDKGIVYLMGLLTQAESEHVTDAARRVGGVQKVVKLFQYIS